MIQDPPALTIHRGFARPSQDSVRRLAGAQTGHVVDAMDGRGAVDAAVRPVAGTDPESAAFVGTAVTARAGPDDNLAVFGALDVARPGDVIAVTTEGWRGSALVGDMVTGMIRNRGCAALVTDGMVRDAAGVLATGLPVFCTGVTPNSPVRNGPAVVGTEISLGGVAIRAGDVLVGDRDGVVVVPRADLGAVVGRLDEILALEQAMEEQVSAGLELPDFYRALVDAGAVQYRD